MKRVFMDFIGRKLVKLIMLFGLVFLLLPLIATISLSFSASFTFPSWDLTLQWYENFFSYTPFIDGLKVSLLLGILTFVASTTMGIGFSLVIVRHSFKGKDLINNLSLAPLTLPGVATGMSLFLFFIYVGLQGSFIRLFLAHQIIALPYVIRVISAALYRFDRSLEESAMNLGATPFKTFIEITLPLIKPGIFAAGIFAFIASFNEISATVFLVDPRTMTFPIVIFSYMRQYVDPVVSAASAIPIFSVLVVMFFLERYIGLNKAMGIGGITGEE